MDEESILYVWDSIPYEEPKRKLTEEELQKFKNMSEKFKMFFEREKLLRS